MIQTIFNKFFYYLSSNNWGSYLLLIILALSLFLLILRPQNRYCRLWFPAEKHFFDRASPCHRRALAFLLAALGIFAAVIFSLENSFFNNPDMMSTHTINMLYQGVEASFGLYWRTRPAAFWEYNILFTLTDNPYWFNLYVISLMGLLCLLLYKLLAFITVTRRLYLIGTIILIPGLFWLNNIIFYDLQMLIYIMLSMLCWQKFCRCGRKMPLAFFVLFLNLALYSKESCILFYAGILAALLLYHLWQGNLFVRKFLHPQKLLNQFPVEAAMFVSMLIYTVIFLVGSGELDHHPYLENRTGDHSWLGIASLYHFEIILAAVAAVLVYQALKHRRRIPLMLVLWLSGSYVLAGTLLLGLKLVTIGEYMEYKSYYLVISAVFLLIFIFSQLQRPGIFAAALVLIGTYAAVFNAFIYTRQQGKSYRAAAEAASLYFTPGKTVSIFISQYTEPPYWALKNYLSIFKYYYPGQDLVFYTPLMGQEDLDLANILNRKHGDLCFPLNYKPAPETGDIFWVKKSDQYRKDLALTAHLPKLKIFEDRFFCVYKML